MRQCTDDDWKKFYLPETYTTRKEILLKEHKENDVWFCPNAFDLSFWGMKDDLDSKTLTLTFLPTSEAAVQNQELLFLVNNKKVDYGGD